MSIFTFKPDPDAVEALIKPQKRKTQDSVAGFSDGVGQGIGTGLGIVVGVFALGASVALIKRAKERPRLA
jgi:hypothetical protein